MISVCEENKCMGCAVCANVCPTAAVSMSFDNEGFLHPIVSEDKCIGCGMCVRKCPANRSSDFHFPICAYKGRSKNKSLLLDSTSGAVFSELANTVLLNGGVVVGAYLDSDFRVKHIVLNSPLELHKIRGSKYLGSDLSGVYKTIKHSIKNKKTVLFSGTPCQIAGLYSFIDIDERNELITVDFICHGVGSQLIFDKFIKYSESKSQSKVIGVSFRSKIRGYNKSSMVIEYMNGKKSIYPSYRNGFGYPFSSGMINRLSCSQCSFAQIGRVSDITLSDCIHDLGLFEKKYGCSYILVNTNKGNQLIDQCKINLKSVDISTVSQHQAHLKGAQPIHKYRSSVMSEIERDYEYLYKMYLHPPKRSILKSIKERVKYARSQWHKG